MLDLAFVNAPFDRTDGIEYLSLGSLEVRVALPEGHPLAALERIPRAALLAEPFVTLSRRANPPVIEDVYKQVFGRSEHPRPIEVATATEGPRLQLVAKARGFTLSILPEAAELSIPGVAFRRMEGPVPLVEYGLAWLGKSASPFVEPFVAEARRVVESSSNTAEHGGQAGVSRGDPTEPSERAS